jgi:hypothetical protein
MNIPEMTTDEVERGLQLLKAQGDFRPTIQELREIHGEGQNIQNIQSSFETDLHSLQQKLEEQLSRAKRDLITIQQELEKHMQQNVTDLQKAIHDHQKLLGESPFISEVTLQSDLKKLEKSATPFTTSIIIWTFIFMCILVIVIYMIVVYRKFTYFRDIFSAGFGNIKIANLKPVMVEHFQHMSRIQHNIPKPLDLQTNDS